MPMLAQIIRLALADYWHERLLSACAVLGLASVLAPLLVLFGIKFGIVDTLTQRLVNDPRNLQVTPVGSGHYDAPWLARAAAQPGVAFVMPQTRQVAAAMYLARPQAGPGAWLAVDLVASGPGDPLLGKYGPVPGQVTEVVLSATAARKLGVTAGEALQGRVARVMDGQHQQAGLELRVMGVLPLEAQDQDKLFVDLALLEACERYRDGFAVPQLGWPGREPPQGPRDYPQFVMYASGLEQVGQLRRWLEEQGLEVYTRAAEIEVVQGLDRAMSLIFRLIALVAMLGFFASTASNALANVKRKARHLGVTRLIGFNTSHIVWYPVVQVLATSLLGVLAAYLLYLGVDLAINQLFASQLRAGERLCGLLPSHLLLAALLTAAVSMAAACLTAFRAARIEPSEVIRDL